MTHSPMLLEKPESRQRSLAVIFRSPESLPHNLVVPAGALCKIANMKAKALIHQQSTESTPLPSEDFAAAVAADARVMRMLHGHNPLYWHQQLHHLFGIAGISTRRIEHVQHHPEWQAWLSVDDFPLAPDKDAAAKQLCQILGDGGLKVVDDQLSIVARRGDKLRIAFRLDLGSSAGDYRLPSRVGLGA